MPLLRSYCFLFGFSFLPLFNFLSYTPLDGPFLNVNTFTRFQSLRILFFIYLILYLFLLFYFCLFIFFIFFFFFYFFPFQRLENFILSRRRLVVRKVRRNDFTAKNFNSVYLTTIIDIY